MIEELRNIFISHGDSKIAIPMEAYLKNRFKLFGIKTPTRKEIAKEWMKKYKPQNRLELIHTIDRLWHEEERDFHYIGLEILKKHHKTLEAQDLPWLQKIICTHSWWDTVDILATTPLGGLVAKESLYEEMDQWIHSDNFWVRRCALIFQLKYKEVTDWERLKSYILKTAHEKEFFIRKAIGWTLREYAKTNPEKVLTFVNSLPELSGLSKREALKHLR